MDAANHFHTRGTYWLSRLDHGVGLALALGALLAHFEQVNWLRFAVAFWWIDALGYWPGALHYRLRPGARRRIPAYCYALYNAAHSWATNAAVVGVWYWVGGFEWAMLAGPAHLFIDGALFGNAYKPLALAFEPVEHAAFGRFARELQASGRW